MCLEAYYTCMVKHEFQHTALVSFNKISLLLLLMFGNHTNLFCHAGIVGN